MVALYNPEEKILCPYDHSHHIRRCRMSTHLMNCKKSYLESKLVECEFNVNHKISESELQYHHENCSDRRKVEITIYQEEGAVINKFPIHKIEVPTEESWDDLNVQSYDPQKYCESNNVLRHIDAEPAATKKDFRLSERQRLRQLNDDKPAGQLQEIVEQNANTNAGPSKRNLPDIPSIKVEEDTPKIIAELVESLTIGRNEVFIPKQI